MISRVAQVVESLPSKLPMTGSVCAGGPALSTRGCLRHKAAFQDFSGLLELGLPQAHREM
jgi:hypothetical protein